MQDKPSPGRPQPGHPPLVTEDPKKTPGTRPAPKELPGGGGVITTDDPDVVKRKEHVRKEEKPHG